MKMLNCCYLANIDIKINTIFIFRGLRLTRRTTCVLIGAEFHVKRGAFCYGEAMHGTRRLSDQELAEIQRRRPAARASLACEGMYLSADEEKLIEQMDEDRLTPDDRAKRITLFHRLRRAARVANAAE